MGDYDFVYVHLKGPDEPGHDGDFEGKKKAIEDIDAGFFSRLGDLSSSFLCVTADHSTPCLVKGHTDDPVPMLILARGFIVMDRCGLPRLMPRKENSGR